MKRLHKTHQKQYLSEICNICNKIIETQNHIYRCVHHARKAHTNNSHKRIDKKAISGGYNKFLIYSLLKGLHIWIHNQLPLRLSRRTNKVRVLLKKAMEERNLLGGTIYFGADSVSNEENPNKPISLNKNIRQAKHYRPQLPPNNHPSR